MIAVAFASCEAPQPQPEKVKSQFETNVRSYVMELPNDTIIRTEFDEYNQHTFNATSKTVSYTNGVNNQPMYEVMDVVDYSPDSTWVAFYKTYPNKSELKLTYEVGKVTEFRSYPNGGTKVTIFELK